jgi:sugar phosphate isomerase/epimerase
MTNPYLGRRSFLTSAALLAGGAALGGCAKDRMKTQSAVTGQRSLDKIGIQLYTVRDMLKADYIGTAKMLKAIGYDQVEYAELPGMPFTTKEFRKVADGEGLEIPSCGFQPEHFFNEFQKVIDITSAAGASYAFNGWIHPPDRTLPNLMKQCEAFNRFGAGMKKAGLTYMYHNHDFEFSKVDGDRTIQDVLMQNTDPELVKFEMDMYWVTHGGGNIVDYLTRYPGRFVACHIKDRTADGKMVYVGDGVIDWKTAIAKAKDVGIKYYFMEHDEPAAPVADGVARSYKYIRNLRF